MTPVIGVCDYGVGNLRSVERALRASGAETVISDEPERIAACDGVVLPGVGAFAVASLLALLALTTLLVKSLVEWKAAQQFAAQSASDTEQIR